MFIKFVLVYFDLSFEYQNKTHHEPQRNPHSLLYGQVRPLFKYWAFHWITFNLLYMTYKGYTIEGETEPWALKYGYNYKVFLDTPDDSTRYAASIEEAKEIIDEIIETQNKI